MEIASCPLPRPTLKAGQVKFLILAEGYGGDVVGKGKSRQGNGQYQLERLALFVLRLEYKLPLGGTKSHQGVNGLELDF